MKPKSAAKRKVERPILVPPWAIATMVVAMSGALVALYPKQDLIAKVAVSEASQLSTFYLQNLLKTDPDNPELHLLLGKQYLLQGDSQRAAEAIAEASASSDPSIRSAANLLLLKLKQAEYFSTNPSERGTRQSLQGKARPLILSLKRSLDDADHLVELADLAFDFELPDEGVLIYKKLALLDVARGASSRWYAQAAIAAIGRGHYRSASELYLLAQQRADSDGSADRYLIAAIEALQSGNLVSEALDLAQRSISKNESSPELLELVTRLALAAGRQDVADTYVRRLLRISFLQQKRLFEFAANHHGMLPLRVSNDASNPGLEFNDRIYTLGYEVFIGNRKLDDARKLASAAVRQAPDNMIWRKRLAETSEWSGVPKEALAHWLVLARKTDEETAWQAVLRLAPGLFDYKALNEAGWRELQRDPGNVALISNIIGYAELEGKPETATDLLQKLSRKNPSPELLDALARLANRAGDNDLSLTTWARLFENPSNFTAERVSTAVISALLLRNNALALEWLMAARPHIDDTEPGVAQFYRLLADASEFANDSTTGIQAFSVLIRLTEATADDYDGLLSLLKDRNPDQAAATGISAWRKFNDLRFLHQSLEIYLATNNIKAISAILPEIEAQPARIARNVGISRLMASFYQTVGRPSLAKSLLRQAIGISPNDSGLLEQYLWLLIDNHDLGEIRQILGTYEGRLAQNDSMHDVLASSYLYLSMPRVALSRYLTPRLEAKKNDFLWMMTYADALEQNQQADQAWRVRKHLLTSLPAVDLQDRSVVQHLADARHLARKRLKMAMNPGDVSFSMLRDLLRLDRDREIGLSDSANQLVIGHLNDYSQHHASAGYMLEKYGRSRSAPDKRPLWAEISITLAAGDKSRAKQLLESSEDALSRYDRIDAAVLASDIRRAQSHAFDLLDSQTDDEPLHTRLTNTLLAYSNSANISAGSADLGSIQENDVSTSLHLNLSPNMALNFSSARIDRVSNDNTAIKQPPVEFAHRLSLRLSTDILTNIKLGVEHHQALGTYTTLSAAADLKISGNLGLTFGYAMRDHADESTLMRVAGYRDSLTLGATGAVDARNQVSIQTRFNSYYLQDGTSLGRGNITTLNWTHALLSGEIPVTVSPFLSRYAFNTPGAVNASFAGSLLPDGTTVTNVSSRLFVPETFYFYGVTLSVNPVAERVYRRWLQPYLSTSLTQHSRDGFGYNVELGIAGSVLGSDQMSLDIRTGKSGPTSSANTQARFSYTYFY